MYRHSCVVTVLQSQLSSTNLVHDLFNKVQGLVKYQYLGFFLLLYWRTPQWSVAILTTWCQTSLSLAFLQAMWTPKFKGWRSSLIVLSQVVLGRPTSITFLIHVSVLSRFFVIWWSVLCVRLCHLTFTILRAFCLTLYGSEVEDLCKTYCGFINVFVTFLSTYLLQSEIMEGDTSLEGTHYEADSCRQVSVPDADDDRCNAEILLTANIAVFV